MKVPERMEKEKIRERESRIRKGRDRNEKEK
jgi:hypothetical protein